MAQGKLGENVELEIHEVPNSKERTDGLKHWRSSTTVRGHEYTWKHAAARKKTAMHEAAAMLLEELLPGEQRVGRQTSANSQSWRDGKGTMLMSGAPCFVHDLSD